MKINPKKFLLHAAAAWISFSSAVFSIMMIIEISTVFGGAFTLLVLGATMFSYLVIVHAASKHEE